MISTITKVLDAKRTAAVAALLMLAFTATAKAQIIKATYSGLFAESNSIAQASSGAITLTTTSKGNFTGKLQMGTARYPIKGTFDSTGQSTISVKRGKQTALQLTLQKSPPTTGDRIIGKITDQTWTAGLTAEKNPYNGKSSICPQFGKYTMAISGTDNTPLQPRGYGYLTVSVTKAGIAKLIGSLADGTKFTQSATFSSAGTIPLYAGLYKGQGSYAGWLRFNQTTGTTPNSTTTWLKPALPKEKYYPAGFTNQPMARTSVYSTPAKGNRIVDLTNALVLVSGGDLSSNLENTVALDSKNHITSPASNKLSLTFSLSNGTFKGKTIDPASRKLIAFSGVVLQSINQALGSFKASTEYGNARMVAMQPDTFFFQTAGSEFTGEAQINSTPETIHWDWSDSTTSAEYPTTSHSFGSDFPRTQSLTVFPSGLLDAVNMGFDASDGGETTPLAPFAPQSVTAVIFPAPLIGLRYWASSYAPITNTLDFTGFTSLEAIECFHCTNLPHVVVNNLPSLRRLCLEECPLQELNISGNPNLEDVRGAVSGYTNVVVGGGTGPKIWHWCTRFNEQLRQNLSEVMTNFYSLQELWIWNDHQTDALTVVSTNLTDVEFQNNYYEFADFNHQANLNTCLAENNSLTNLVLTGCVRLQYLDASQNQFSTEALDGILETLNTVPAIQYVNLANNPAKPSQVGYANYTNLLNRGVEIYVDPP